MVRTIELLLVFVAFTIQVQLPNEMIRGVAITPSGPLYLANNATLLLIEILEAIDFCDTTSSIVFRGPQTVH